MVTNRIILTFASILLIINMFGQVEPKHELRSTWIASVSNIDWPKYEHRNNPEAQQTELIRMLDLYKSINLNAVFLQVRPECDALYNSAYEPWSRYLTWAQGDDPGYDPLAFALEEAHKRGLELHVWMNPYRINASTSDGGSYYHETHIYSEHPEWAIEYSNGKKILNPGRPEVMSYIGSVVRDLLTNYLVDGVHFDDYFYAYDGTPSALDNTEYTQYGNGMSLGAWRRDNVNRMVDTVYKVIQEENPNVRFGVSPFGIYKNGVPTGIAGLDAYSTIYCDPLAWLENESVDYITPQLYWPTGGAQDFETLANWWSDQVFANDRHLYTGHGLYRFSSNPSENKTNINPDLHESKSYFDLTINDSDNLSYRERKNKDTGDPVAAWTLSQIGLQIDIVRLNHDKNGLGNVFFSADDFDRVNGLADYIVQNKYTHPTIIPEMTWKNGDAPNVPQNLRIEEVSSEQMLLWDHEGGSNVRYAIYTSSSLLTGNEIIDDANNISLISFENSVKLEDIDFGSGASFVVTAISAIGKESDPSEVLQPDVDFPIVTLKYPVSSSILSNTDSLGWTSDKNNSLYKLQIATNLNFSNIVYESSWISDTVYYIADADLEGESDYYWRVRAKTELEGPFSDERDFRAGYPILPELTSPVNLQQTVSTNPKIKWTASLVTEQIQVLVSESSSFNTTVADELFSADANESILQTELDQDTWYYLKIQSLNDYGNSGYTAFVSFKTTSGTIPDVYIESPEDGATIASFDQLKWNSTVTEGTISYKLEIALDQTFDVVVYQSDWMSDKQRTIQDFNIDGQKTYFWHVKAQSEFGESEYTDGRSFFAGYPTRPTITAPQNLSEDVDTRPEMGWNSDATTDSVYFEFSEQSNFSVIFYSERFSSDNSTAKLSAHLNELTLYYVQMRAENEYGSSVLSSKKSFETGLGNKIHNKEDIALHVYPTVLTSDKATVKFSLKNEGKVKLFITDVLGKKVIDLNSGEFGAGEYEFEINRNHLPEQSMYFVNVKINDRNYTIKLIVK